MKLSGALFRVVNLKTEALCEIESDGRLGTVDSMSIVKGEIIWEEDDESEIIRNYAQLMIELVVEPGRDLYVFTVNGNKDVIPSRDWRAKPIDEDDAALDEAEGTKIYRCSVPVVKSELNGDATTKSPFNSLRLLEPLGDGWFQMWRVSIVAQNGLFFLVEEQVYEKFRLYKSGNTIICPFFQKDEEEHRKGWPALITLLNRVVKGKAFQELPPFQEISNDPPLPGFKNLKKGLKTGQARVAWFSNAEQFGMLVTPEGNARVHWSQIERPNSERRFLKPGELVSYKELTKPHNTTARETSFKLEAVGVSLIQQG